MILDPPVAHSPAEFRLKNVQRSKSVSMNLVQKDASQVKRTTTAMTPRLGQPLFSDRKCACLQMEKIVVSARIRRQSHGRCCFYRSSTPTNSSKSCAESARICPVQCMDKGTLVSFSIMITMGSFSTMTSDYE